jgi:hypothetical protein
MLVVGEGVEAEVEQALTVSLADGVRKEEAQQALPVVRMGPGSGLELGLAEEASERPEGSHFARLAVWLCSLSHVKGGKQGVVGGCLWLGGHLRTMLSSHSSAGWLVSPAAGGVMEEGQCGWELAGHGFTQPRHGVAVAACLERVPLQALVQARLRLVWLSTAQRSSTRGEIRWMLELSTWWPRIDNRPETTQH